MKELDKAIRALALAACGLPFLLACPGGSDDAPEIVLAAIDCPKDSITVTPSAELTGSGVNKMVSGTITVDCGGVRAAYAEIKVSYWFGVEEKLTTQNGEFTFGHQAGGIAAGETQTITFQVEGSDGTKTATTTVTAQ